MFVCLYVCMFVCLYVLDAVSTALQTHVLYVKHSSVNKGHVYISCTCRGEKRV